LSINYGFNWKSAVTINNLERYFKSIFAAVGPGGDERGHGRAAGCAQDLEPKENLRGKGRGADDDGYVAG